MASEAGADFRIFCLAISGRTEALRQADLSGLDWHRFVEGAQRHRLEQQLLASFKAACVPLPKAFTELRIVARVAAHQSLLQMRETARLAALFEKAGIPL